MSKRPNRMKRDALSRKAKRVAQAEAKADVKPQHIWVRPAPELGDDRFQVCYRLGEGKPTVVARDVVAATPKEWERYVRFQAQFRKDRGRTKSPNKHQQRGLAQVAMEAASKQAGCKVARRDVWVIPAVGLRANRYRILFNNPISRSVDQVRHTVTASESMWSAFCNDQENLTPGFKRGVDDLLRQQA